VDPVLQRIVSNVLDECLAATRVHSTLKESDRLIWLREGILALGPTGPIPVPPHGPMLDILLGVAIGSLANQLSDVRDQATLRHAILDLIARTATRAARAELSGGSNGETGRRRGEAQNLPASIAP
jgi:hypothetical protein